MSSSLLLLLSGSFVGDVGDLGDLENLSELEDGDLENDSIGDNGGARGDDGEGVGQHNDSSLGVLSILIIGGTPSTDLDLLPPFGDGDLDLLVLLDPKFEL